MTKTRPKPKNPYEDFPLFPHPNGQWCKKIRGKQHFRGVWANPIEAQTEYLRVRDFLQAGRKPPTPGNGCRLKDLCNRFVNTKRAMVDTQELSLRTFRDYHAGWSVERILREYDHLTAEDIQACLLYAGATLKTSGE